jgi:hypothetical protein
MALGVVLGGYRWRLLDASAVLGRGERPTDGIFTPSRNRGGAAAADRDGLRSGWFDAVVHSLGSRGSGKIVGAYHRCVADTVGCFARDSGMMSLGFPK